jgi:putative oxygen-independent coproporphyrinogen III oxidase
MPIITANIPLSLYIHLPWCVQKCPYCDFNSHALKAALPEADYVRALLADFDAQLPLIQGRPLVSIFFGGGTPSLFSGAAIQQVLNHVAKHVALPPEITLEANPGTVDEARFHDFHLAGVNRLSLGVQSLQDDKLKTLGRIHGREAALRAIAAARKAGFDNLNIDLMFALPDQSIDDALSDLQTALAEAPTHLSWYQLTIEPNTLFHHQPPVLPSDDFTLEMQLAGQTLLKEKGFQHYEVSAYAKGGLRCAHNLNYWEFGDYLGIGAGAHSKITRDDQVLRFMQPKHPQSYLREAHHAPMMQVVSAKDLVFEFMLNGLRLSEGVPVSLFSERTGLEISLIKKIIDSAVDRGLLENNSQQLKPTEKGRLFLNALVEMFL